MNNEELLKMAVDLLRNMTECIRRRGRLVYTRAGDGEWVEIGDDLFEYWEEALDFLEIFPEE